MYQDSRQFFAFVIEIRGQGNKSWRVTSITDTHNYFWRHICHGLGTNLTCWCLRWASAIATQCRQCRPSEWRRAPRARIHCYSLSLQGRSRWRGRRRRRCICPHWRLPVWCGWGWRRRGRAGALQGGGRHLDEQRPLRIHGHPLLQPDRELLDEKRIIVLARFC